MRHTYLRIKDNNIDKKMKLLEGKTCLVTGAARGIGKALALRFAAEGANIAFTDLVIDENGKQTEEEIKALGVECKGYASNAADFVDTPRLFATSKLSRMAKATPSSTAWVRSARVVSILMPTNAPRASVSLMGERSPMR